MKVKSVVLLLFLLLLACSEDNILTPEAQREKDLKKIDQYLIKNGVTATVDPTGLRYTILVQGTGAYPSQTSLMTVKYTGRLMANEKLFDQSTDPPGKFKTPLSGLIEGWQVGFKYFPVGTKAVLYVPSAMGYGPAGGGDGLIPPNSNLIFEVELIAFTN